MQKVAFYLNNPSMKERDYSDIKDGNPGLAGSEYEFLLVPYLLQERENGIEPYLLVNFKGTFPHNNVGYIKDLEDSCNYCVANGIDLIVVDVKYLDFKVLDKYASQLSVFIWAHNTVSYKQLDACYARPYIKKIINVGREQMELYRDHLATLKSTFIYNILPIKPKEYYLSKQGDKNNHNVVYMASLVRAKGFHVLAKAWKKVLEKVPDAQLYVIGNGQVYDSNAELGKYGIASPDYEAEFMPYLTDSQGAILPSVHFMGKLGEEKYDVMGLCKVGVPNPTGESETFCICGIEMQLMGSNITTIKYPAYLDTIMNKQYLYKKESMLAKFIADRLLAPSDDYDIVYDFVHSKFGIEGNIQKWEKIILNRYKSCLEPVSLYNYQHKNLKDILLKLKCKCILFRVIPPIERLLNVYRRFIN